VQVTCSVFAKAMGKASRNTDLMLAVFCIHQ
jgi:hypothetical protein